MQGALTRMQVGLLSLVGAAVVFAGVLHFGDVGDVATFIVCGIALAGVAWVVSFATEAVGSRLGPAFTGVLQSTLGNLPELFVVLFALSAGELVVAQYSILGSLFANALLVLGAVIIAGAHQGGGIMRFGSRLPNDTATLLLLATFGLVLLGISDEVGDRASEHIEEISVIGAVVLLTVYAVWLFTYLRGNPPEAAVAPAQARVPMPIAIALLALAGVAAALVSDWFVHALGPAVDELGISRQFTGLVIVAIAGNAVENVVGVVLAAKGQSDLAISVVKNSVAQIAVFLFPLLVLASMLFTHHLTFQLAPVYVGAIVLTAIALWQITGDGEATMFEGVALIAMYVTLGAFAWLD